MGQYSFAGWRLSSSYVTLPAAGPAGRREHDAGTGNAAGGRAGRPPGVWTVSALSTGRVGVRAADTARRASRVTSR